MALVNISGFDKDTAVLLLAAAEELGLGVDVVLTDGDGFVVPEEVAVKAAESAEEARSAAKAKADARKAAAAARKAAKAAADTTTEV